MKGTLLLFLFVLSLGHVHATTVLKIGCSTECDSDTKNALKKISATLSLKVKISNLATTKKINWNALDGIVIPGGDDIAPKYYLPFVESELQSHIRSLDHLVEYTDLGEERDAFEYTLLKEYYNDPELTNFPLLGICRGMQMMTVALGIPLYVDIKTELGIENRRDLYDQIEVTDADSLINKIFNHPFSAYKFHHQGLRVPYYHKHVDRWPNVKVTAYSNERRIAESLEIQDRPALGIQFHPEVDQGNIRKSIFNWFLKKALERKSSLAP